jgi:hypothetical protein
MRKLLIDCPPKRNQIQNYRGENTSIRAGGWARTGHSYQVAKAYEEGAKSEEAEVRVRKVRELAPRGSHRRQPGVEGAP